MSEVTRNVLESPEEIFWCLALRVLVVEALPHVRELLDAIDQLLLQLVALEVSAGDSDYLCFEIWDEHPESEVS